MAQPTKMQIETAEKVLYDALRNKSEEIAKRDFEADTKKYKAAMTAFYKKAIALREEFVAFKKTVEKNPKLRVEVDSYNSPVKELPSSLEEAEEMELIRPKDSNYSNKLGSYYPDLSKEKKEIERFILNLKLGTAVMADIDKIISKISAIK